MERLGTLLEQLDDRRIEADRDCTGDLKDKPSPRRRPAPPFAGPIAMPRPVHPQMRPDHEAVVEPDQKVLADGLDGRDLTPDHAVDLRHGTRAAGLRGRHGAADQVRPETRGGPEERVAFGHSGVERQRRDARGTRR